MHLKTALSGRHFSFASVKEVLAKASEEKSGDILAGVAAESSLERVAAKEILANMLLRDIRSNPVVPYEEDDVTRIIQDDIDEAMYNKIANWSVAELREWLLDYATGDKDIAPMSRALSSEMISAVTKLMSNMDLVYAARKMEVTAHCNTTIGRKGTLGIRLQPNHTTDNVEGITASLLEGLSYGAGDAVIGLNPVTDSVANVSAVLERFHEVRLKYAIPTQCCVLAHITTQMEAIKKGAPSDLIFQSIAGSQKGNEAFGFTANTVREAHDLMREKGRAEGPNLLYFETGQGAELSSCAHYGADQVTMEARCYGFARRFSPFLVNTVVGFIGPEFLYDSKQVIRAGLEDHFMGKLSGIPMGCDCCYTNHMAADQNDLENLSLLLALAGCNFFITVPGSDDIMLNYQTNAYQDAAAIREITGLRPLPEFEAWLEKMGILQNGRLTPQAGDPTMFLDEGRIAHA